MDQVIAVAAEDLYKTQPESSLGNLLAQIVFEAATDKLATPPDFSIQNYGGIRVPMLAAGDITRGRVYELMPFDNYIVVMHLEGSIVLRLINHMASKGGWPVHGLTYVISDGEATEIEIGGQPFQSRRMYSVALPDYVANGGDYCDFLVGQPRQETGILVRDAILLYMYEASSQGRPIGSKTDGRVRYAN
jgi:2',3'-cyclic-nucleotide 2'-phosphodiesterase (5'-nucleotidase family)